MVDPNTSRISRPFNRFAPVKYFAASTVAYDRW
jgi:hypothetical protein